jgi:prepilin signal peptidase PulO-like enzyme (type II secretory pathway)
MFLFGLLLVFVLGLVLGSFISCISYRIPKDISFLTSRSFCPKCKKIIRWYDNIPLVSFLVLGGKCRNCGKKISIRYPLIEATTGLIFAFAYFLFINCSEEFYFCSWQSRLGDFTLPFLLFVLFLIFAIFVIDSESMIIPDELVFLGFVVSFFVFLFFDIELFPRLFMASFLSSLLLLLHIATRGRGMGLGDVKFALFAGFLFDGIIGVYWLFSSFLIGAVVGLFLIMIGRARFQGRIPFGPFLAISLILFLFFGNAISKALGFF